MIVFDFATSDRLVCTEVIYRSYHGVGDIEFILSSMAGRNCLSAEGFLNQAISGKWFDPIITFGVRGNDFHKGSIAKTVLARSFKASF